MKISPFLLLFFILFNVTYLSAESYSSISKEGSEVLESSNSSAVEDNIQQFLQRIDNLKTKKFSNQKILGNSFIKAIYDSVKYSALWENKVNRADLITILENSYYEGLNPDDYHLKYIKSHHLKLEKGERINDKELAKADIIMTNAVLTFSHHMIQGKVNQSKLDPNWNYSKKAYPERLEFRLLTHLKNESLLSAVDNIRPKLDMYKKLKRWFAHYDSIYTQNGTVEKLVYPGKALRLGDSSAVVGELSQHLRNFVIGTDSVNSNVFDKQLEDALKDFQKYNGLEVDGIAGTSTFDAINISLKDRLDIIRVNMERCRWLNGDIPSEFLMVNIADFHLYIFRNNEISYQSKVVVGKLQNETPVFTSKIKYVVFNPTWTVPYSISSKEILPKLKRDPKYLQSRNMTLLQGNKVIDPGTVDFNNYSAGNFPFTIRQEPGPKNALGRIKFIFPNKFAVYLHDTPSKSYFNKSERTFSHGCVRVQNPELLAEQLLGDKGYDQSKIKSTLDAKTLKNVYLSKPMPIMLIYWTCYEAINEQKMYFYKDVYGRDQAILKELNEAL